MVRSAANGARAGLRTNKNNHKGSGTRVPGLFVRAKRMRVAAFAVGVALGSAAAYQYWPLLQTFFTPAAHESKPQRSAARQPVPDLIAPTPPVPSDPKLAAAGTDSSISKKPLALVLVGTMPGRNAREGSAMLGTDARNAQTFMAGALIENGARLAEIYRDRVILERGGERATLYLAGSGSHAEAATKGTLLTVGGQTPQQPKKVRYSTDPVTEYIRAVPFYRDDVVAGFRVFPGSRSGPFQQWGLRPGDVIVSLDGSPLMDGDQTTQLLSALAEGASLSAKVLRGPDTLTVALDGAAIVKLNEAQTRQVALQPAP
jgi:general secretion pathway protein C